MTDDRRPTDDVKESNETADLVNRDGAISVFAEGDGAIAEPATATQQMGSARYVHASFIAAAVLVGYIASQVFALVWNSLAAWPVALQYVPQLVRYDESVRGDVGLVVGAIIGIITVIRIYRKPKIRVWADEVAAELTKVSWPDREAVTNNTIIVVVASLVATIYVTILDRFWGFATGLIYAQ